MPLIGYSLRLLEDTQRRGARELRPATPLRGQQRPCRPPPPPTAPDPRGQLTPEPATPRARGPLPAFPPLPRPHLRATPSEVRLHLVPKPVPAPPLPQKSTPPPARHGKKFPVLAGPEFRCAIHAQFSGGWEGGWGGRGGALQVDSEIGAGGVAREKGGFPFRRHIQAFSPHPSPAHTRAHTRARWKKPLVGKSQRGRPATPLRRRYKCTLTRPSPAPVLRQRQPRPNNFCIRASAGRLSAAPGRGSLHGHRSPLKPKPGWQSCSSAPPRSPAGLSPPALPRLGAASRSGDSGGRGPPPRSGWRWVGVRAEGCSPLLRPRAAPAAAGAVSAGLGRPPAAGGAARSRPGDAGRGRGPPAPPASPAPAEREVAANKCKLFGPPGRRGENPRSGAGLPPARVGFAAARRGSGASPPRGAGRLAGRFTAPLHSAPS